MQHGKGGPSLHTAQLPSAFFYSVSYTKLLLDVQTQRRSDRFYGPHTCCLLSGLHPCQALKAGVGMFEMMVVP
jgi:hypothetical protein